MGLCARHPAHAAPAPATWTPDNGNGTFTKPIFYDEFSDPDLIRVGDWFYLTGTVCVKADSYIIRNKFIISTRSMSGMAQDRSFDLRDYGHVFFQR